MMLFFQLDSYFSLLNDHAQGSQFSRGAVALRNSVPHLCRAACGLLSTGKVVATRLSRALKRALASGEAIVPCPTAAAPTVSSLCGQEVVENEEEENHGKVRRRNGVSNLYGRVRFSQDQYPRGEDNTAGSPALGRPNVQRDKLTSYFIDTTESFYSSRQGAAIMCKLSPISLFLNSYAGGPFAHVARESLILEGREQARTGARGIQGRRAGVGAKRG